MGVAMSRIPRVPHSKSTCLLWLLGSLGLGLGSCLASQSETLLGSAILNCSLFFPEVELFFFSAQAAPSFLVPCQPPLIPEDLVHALFLLRALPEPPGSGRELFYSCFCNIWHCNFPLNLLFIAHGELCEGRHVATGFAAGFSVLDYAWK